MILALPLAVILLYVLYQYAKMRIVLHRIIKSRENCKYWEGKLGL